MGLEMPIPGGNSCLCKNTIEGQVDELGPRIEAAADRLDVLATVENAVISWRFCEVAWLQGITDGDSEGDGGGMVGSFWYNPKSPNFS